MNANFEVLHIPYDGNNLKLLLLIKQSLGHGLDDCLFRASEKCEMWRTLMYGTDRGGYPPKYWQDGKTPFEDVVFATTEEDILLGEAFPDRSSSFKKFALIKDPVLLIYSKSFFTKVEDRQWKFNEKSADYKFTALTHIVFIDKVYPQ